MFRLFRSARGARPGAPPRARLALEALDGRYVPSALPTGGQPALDSAYAAPANAAPVIVDFTDEEVGIGLFILTGRVVGEAPGGLTVTFGGAVASISGRTVVTDEDGNFSLLVRVKADGTESGTVSATVTDAQGVQSAAVYTYISPTSPTPP
jgi:hypothetical protein